VYEGKIVHIDKMRNTVSAEVTSTEEPNRSYRVEIEIGDFSAHDQQRLQEDAIITWTVGVKGEGREPHRLARLKPRRPLTHEDREAHARLAYEMKSLVSKLKSVAIRQGLGKGEGNDNDNDG
jgi:hypothetical protein